MTADGVDLVFSAVEAEPARTLEPRFAAHVPVVSTASAFRYEPDVPILLPGRIVLLLVQGLTAQVLRNLCLMVHLDSPEDCRQIAQWMKRL